MSTVTEIKETDFFYREINTGLMTMFINNHLSTSAGLDVSKSIVLYDGARTFVYALEELPDEETLQRLHDQTNVRHWSKGIV